MAQIFLKDPEATLDFAVDWSEWLGSDTISTSTWTVPTGITKDSDSATTTKATIWLKSGSAGKEYSIVNKIVTAGGRTDERMLVIKVIQR